MAARTFLKPLTPGSRTPEEFRAAVVEVYLAAEERAKRKAGAKKAAAKKAVAKGAAARKVARKRATQPGDAS
jgi:hypothetical protein